MLIQLKHVTVESIRFATIVAKANGTANEQAHAQAHEEAHEEAHNLEYGKANARAADEETDGVTCEEENDLVSQQEHDAAHDETQPAQDEDRTTLEPTGLTGRVWQFVKAKVTPAN